MVEHKIYCDMKYSERKGEEYTSRERNVIKNEIKGHIEAEDDGKGRKKTHKRRKFLARRFLPFGL